MHHGVPLAASGRTSFKRLTLGMRFERFLVAFFALLDRFVAMIISSFDLVPIYSFNLPDRRTLQEQFRLREEQFRCQGANGRFGGCNLPQNAGLTSSPRGLAGA